MAAGPIGVGGAQAPRSLRVLACSVAPALRRQTAACWPESFQTIRELSAGASTLPFVPAIELQVPEPAGLLDTLIVPPRPSMTAALPALSTPTVGKSSSSPAPAPGLKMEVAGTELVAGWKTASVKNTP